MTSRGPGGSERARGDSLGERVARLLRRLSWRTPVHSLRLRGRYPLQLIGVPADPIPGRARAGRALLEGRMLFGNEAVALADLPAGRFSAALADHYQSFAWLRDLGAAANHEEGGAAAEALAARWLDTHTGAITAAWRPDLWGRRILFWTAYAPYVIGGREPQHRTRVLNALARGARHLDAAANTAPQGVARVAAWAGVVAAGLLIPGGDLRVAHGEAGLSAALAAALGDDGGLAARVPAMQLDLIELLVQLRAVYEVRARPLPATIARALEKAVPALAAVVLGDGGLSSWQGGGPALPERIAAAFAGSGVRALPLVTPKGWGYQRLVSGPLTLVADAGPPPAGALVKGGSASTLAFELAEGPQRIVVNCGGGPGLPAELAEGLRTTAAHSTLVLAETNSTAVHADGSLGRGVTEVAVERRDSPGGVLLDMAHDGYVRRFGFRHGRRLVLAADGRGLSGEDRLEPAGRRRAPAATRFTILFHLAPGIDPVLTAAARGALLRPEHGEAWQFRADAGTLALEDSVWIDALGRSRPARLLALSGETPPDGTMVSWSLRKVR